MLSANTIVFIAKASVTNSIENRALTCTMCNHAKHIYSLDTFKDCLNHIKSANFKCLL